MRKNGGGGNINKIGNNINKIGDNGVNGDAAVKY